MIKHVEVIGRNIERWYDGLGLGLELTVDVEEDVVEQFFGLFRDVGELLVEEVTADFLPIFKNVNTYIFNTTALYP